MPRLVIFLLFFLFENHLYANPKFDKWREPSFFRGFNIQAPKTAQDFYDLKKTGANLVQISVWGINQTDPPYGTIQPNIDSTDKFVKYCDDAGLYFVIAVRSGPGAYDVYLEMEGITPSSRIWDADNFSERKLYADMLKQIVGRYSEDTLFAGINLIVEPRPNVRFIPANCSGLYKRFLENIFDIQMGSVYRYFVEQVREVDSEIPIIIENFAFSNPELFPAYEINDPYIIYDAHLYAPYELTKSGIPYSRKYPGRYKNITTLSKEFHDKDFLKSVIFGELRNFQIKTNHPVFIGEFGLKHPQNGGEKYLNDVLEICIQYGWHFALWEWRGTGEDWNIEKFQDKKYWEVIVKHM